MEDVLLDDLKLCESIRISIKETNTKTFSLEVESNCTIEKIKQLINNRKNIPIKQQRIIFKGKELENEFNLSYYHIKDDSQLHLIHYEPLEKILRDHDLYDALYSQFNDNHIDIDMLQNHLPENEIVEFCDEFKLNVVEKVHFRKLMKNINPDHKMEMILLGDHKAGKTWLARKYLGKYVSEPTTSTIGVDGQQVTENVGKSTVEITIWDTAGQERYHSAICRAYYRRADCVIICYDVSKNKSFDNCKKWREDIEKYAPENVVVVLVGCKSDQFENKQIQLLDVSKAQSTIEQREWTKFNTIHFHCSAKTDYNVRNVFLAAAKFVLLNREKSTDEAGLGYDTVVIDSLARESAQTKASCCF